MDSFSLFVNQNANLKKKNMLFFSSFRAYISSQAQYYKHLYL